MSGVGEVALDALNLGTLGDDFSLSVPFCRSDSARPKLGPADNGLIYDVITGGLLIWNSSRWEKRDGTPVRTYPFRQSEPRFADVPRMGAVITCIPGVFAGFPAPTLNYSWNVDGEYYPGNFTAQFGRNADELAFMKQGREIRCNVEAYQALATGGVSSLNYAHGRAVGYIQPALPVPAT